MRTIVIALTTLFWISPASAGHDEDAIKHLLHSSFDKPESRLIVDPVVVAGSHAIAGWSQGDMGGRALLRSKGGGWSLILCSGDGIKSREALRHAGLPAADAAELAHRWEEAERTVAPERLMLFAKFEGTLMMDASGGQPQHPPTQHAPHPPMQQAQMQHRLAQQPQTQASAAPTFKAGDLMIEAPWLRATPQGAQVAGGYMKIANTGRTSDRLVGGTLDHARRFEIHETTMVDNVMRMRPLSGGLEIKPGEIVELKPGSYHIMGMDLGGGYKEGQKVKGTLEFEKAGTIGIEYVVHSIGSAAPARMQH